MASVIDFPVGSRHIVADAVSAFVGVFEGFEGPDKGVRTRRADRRVILVGPDGTGKTKLADFISRDISSRLNVKAPVFHHDYATGLAWFKSMNVKSGYAKTMEGDLAHSWVVYDRHPAIDFPVYDVALRGGSLVKPYLSDPYDTTLYHKWFRLPVVRKALEGAIVILLQDQKVEPSPDRGDPEGIQDAIGNLYDQYDNAIVSLCQPHRSLIWSQNTVIFREKLY